jgi:thiosulfate dehydrogenase [quinone] large subunit
MTVARNASRAFTQERTFEDPGFIKWLFGSPKMALLFLPLRLYLGWQWLSAGIEKVNSPAWTRTGTALQGFWAGAVKAPAGAKGAAVHYGWYHDFLQFMLNNHWYTWFAKLIAFGETALGIMLIIGAFTGLAAIAGAFMNFNFMLAGSASINPVLFVLAIVLLIGWKVAGYIGVDYYLLPAIGTPWEAGYLADTVREPRAERPPLGRTLAGAVGWFALFALAAVAAVQANNVWNAAHPVVGYLVALLAVVVAFLAGVALLTATHNYTGASEGAAGTQRQQPA